MLWVPQKGLLRVEHNMGAVGTATPGTSVTTGGAVGTKGSPATLIAATAFDSYWMTIIASNYALATFGSDGSMDILVGAATEEVLIADLLMGSCGGTGAAGTGPKRWDFPIYIPAGTRLACQATGRRTATAVSVAVILSGGNGYPPYRVGSKVTTYGITSAPTGTAVTPGLTGAEGAYAQIVASTTDAHFAFVPSFQVSNDATTQNKQFMIDIGIGAATEEEIAQSYWFCTDVNEMVGGPFNTLPAFLDVPSGTRLAMRGSCSTSPLDGGYDAAIHAVSA